ncbi:glycosyltransferase family 2 protein [Arthrobacter sp. GMC3]|uniref:glycosyltransferase family 2 protein n=1 Tax=Arthrobacter sp. GMC3 TaxID=2058894 RepID=UPI0027961198|nr:glycosyltransferase family 2 protein [Arthrobacter sp. GMC3]
MKKARTKKRVRAAAAHGMPATVTVIILCYNYGHYLPEATESALAQLGVDVDVIIVDDKSTDGSVHVARGLALIHQGTVSVIENEVNLGLVGTFNVGLAAATGEFVVRIDADDLLTPGSLKRGVDVARAFPGVGLIYGHPLHFRGDSLPAPRTLAKSWTVWSGLQWLEDRCRGGDNVMTSPEVMMRRATVEKAGPVRNLPHTNDMEMWLRMAAHGDVAYIHGADQAWHRDHPGSMSEQEVDELLDLRERAGMFDVLFGEPGLPLTDAPKMHQLAYRTLASQAVLSATHEIDCGRGQGALVASYLYFARSLVENPASLRAWRGLERRRKERLSGVASTVVAACRRTRRRVASEVRWYRWHRTGVY